MKLWLNKHRWKNCGNRPVIWFIPILIGAHSQTKCLVWGSPGGSRIRCGESGTPSTTCIIYTRWSSRHDGLGCHAPTSMPLKLFKWNAKRTFCSGFHSSETTFRKFPHVMIDFLSKLVITSVIMTRYHMWCGNNKRGVFFTLWNNKTHGHFVNFLRKGVMKRSVCFARLSTYDGPVFTWIFFCHILMWLKKV